MFNPICFCDLGEFEHNGWLFTLPAGCLLLGQDMCGTNEKTGMPIMGIPFTINWEETPPPPYTKCRASHRSYPEKLSIYSPLLIYKREKLIFSSKKVSKKLLITPSYRIEPVVIATKLPIYFCVKCNQVSWAIWVTCLLPSPHSPATIADICPTTHPAVVYFFWAGVLVYQIWHIWGMGLSGHPVH